MARFRGGSEEEDGAFHKVTRGSLRARRKETYGRQMYRTSDADTVWSAQMSVQHALTSLVHAHAAHWQGSASSYANSDRMRLVDLGNEVHGMLHQMRLLLEEMEALSASALQEVSP